MRTLKERSSQAFRGDSARAELDTLQCVAQTAKTAPVSASPLSPFAALRTKEPANLPEATRSDSGTSGKRCDCGGRDAGGANNAAGDRTSRHASYNGGDAVHFQRPTSPRSAA